MVSQIQTSVPKWEAVSIRRCETGKRSVGGSVTASGGGPPVVSPGRMLLNCQPVIAFVTLAYIRYANGQNHPFERTRIVGGPSWITSDELYTINAKAVDVPSSAVMQG